MMDTVPVVFPLNVRPKPIGRITEATEAIYTFFLHPQGQFGTTDGATDTSVMWTVPVHDSKGAFPHLHGGAAPC